MTPTAPPANDAAPPTDSESILADVASASTSTAPPARTSLSSIAAVTVLVISFSENESPTPPLTPAVPPAIAIATPPASLTMTALSTARTLMSCVAVVVTIESASILATVEVPIRFSAHEPAAGDADACTAADRNRAGDADGDRFDAAGAGRLHEHRTLELTVEPAMRAVVWLVISVGRPDAGPCEADAGRSAGTDRE